MKKIYVIILFLIFFNIFTFMFSVLNIFPYAYGTGNPSYNITSDENMSSQTVFENTTGMDISYGDILRLFIGNIANLGDLLLSIGILGASIAAAWLTRSAAPFIVGFIGNIMKNIYATNIAVFNQFPINNYLMLAAGVGMIILFLITCAEVLTHGHGEV